MPTSFPTPDPAWLTQPLVTAATAADYIPQQAPFALIDTLYQCAPAAAWAGLHIAPDHLLVQHGYLSEAGIIECMAQAVALKSGYEARQQAADAAPRVGFIAALKDVQIQALPPAGSRLLVHVEILLQALDVLVVRTTAHYAATRVGQCELRLFLEPAPVPPAAPAVTAHALTR